MVPAQDAVECAGCVYNPVHNSVPFFCVLRMCCVPVPGGKIPVVPFLQNKTRMSPRFVGGILVCVDEMFMRVGQFHAGGTAPTR